MNSRLNCAILLLALASSAFAADETQQAAATASYSPELLQVSETLTLAGKVDLPLLAATYPDGVLLIDLRTPAEEGVDAEQREAAERGLNYQNLPVAGATIDAQQLQLLRQLLAARSGSEHVVLHCASGNRAAMMWGALQIDAGEDLESTLESLQSIATKEPIQAALREYAGPDES